MDSDKLLCWNARGLNSRGTHDLVASFVIQHGVSLLCIQESKLHVIDDHLMTSMLGLSFSYDFVLANCHTRFLRPKTRCSSYVCPRSSCHTYGQNVSTEYQYLYYIISYYKNLL
jgi:hypothetical protein